MNKLTSIGQLEWLRNKILAQSGDRKTIVHVCMTGCRAYGAEQVRDSIIEEIEKQGISDDVEVRSTGCHGFCAKAPVIAIEPMVNAGGNAIQLDDELLEAGQCCVHRCGLFHVNARVAEQIQRILGATAL